jgi:hypothetical protein
LSQHGERHASLFVTVSRVSSRWLYCAAVTLFAGQSADRRIGVL